MPRCQTSFNQSQFAAISPNLGGTKLTLLEQSNFSGQFESVA